MRRVAVVLLAAACGGGQGDGDDVATVIDAPGTDALALDAPALDARPLDARPTDAPPPPPPIDAGIPPGALRVFVSSQRYPANLRAAGGQSTGRAAADVLCQGLADAAELGGTWRAWLSTTDRDAIDHIQGNGPWHRLDGMRVFANHAALSTTPMAAIAIDERLQRPDPFYESWTGTAIGGRVMPPGNRLSVTCWDWTSTVDSTQVGGLLGVYGENGTLGGTSDDWTDYAVGYCSPFSRHLYCFEQ